MAGQRSSAKKKTAASAPRKRAAKPRPASDSIPEPSESEIRVRAYFIAERRVQLSLGGDPANDWIEARQQLIEEARKPRS